MASGQNMWKSAYEAPQTTRLPKTVLQYLESQVAQNVRPLYQKGAYDYLKVALNYRPLALEAKVTLFGSYGQCFQQKTPGIFCKIGVI